MRSVFVRLPTRQQQHLPAVVDALEYVVLDEPGPFRIQSQVSWQQVGMRARAWDQEGLFALEEMWDFHIGSACKETSRAAR
jgi:hypothetical protein